MPPIAALTLNQVNKQLSTLDIVQAQVNDAQAKANFAAEQIAIADPIHAPATTNNVSFTWTGSTGILSWPAGWIKDKNASAQTTASVPPISSVPGQQHIYAVAAGTTSLA